LPTIRIDDDVFNALKLHAEPLVDTPNSVMRRILGLAATVNGNSAESADSAPTSRRRASKSTRRRKMGHTRAKAGSILSDAEYQLPILQILEEKGGRAPTREVIDALGQRLDGRLSETDRAPLASGDIRWRNRAQFVRLKLIEQGDMRKGSPRGVWEVTEQGLARSKAFS